MSDDLVALVGTISTMSASGEVETVLIHDGRVQAVGDLRLARECHAVGGSVVELPTGSLAIPGFVDAHTHAGHIAAGRVGAVDCRAPGVSTIADLLDRLSAVRDSDSGRPLVGYGNLFFDKKIRDGRLPNRADLDRVSSERPIVFRAGGHTSVLNSAALELLEATAIEGQTGRARITRDEHGRATGQVSEVDSLLPLPSINPDELSHELASVTRQEFTASGYTTVGEMVESRAEAEALSAAIAAGNLSSRLHGYVMVPQMAPLDEAIGMVAAGHFGGLPLQGVKLFLDGGFSARQAAVRTPYVDGSEAGWTGELTLDEAALREILARCREADVEVAIHVNGERALDLALRAAAQLHRPGSVRLEHAGNYASSPDTINEIADSSLTAVINPPFLTSYIGDFFGEILGPGNVWHTMPVRSLLEAGVPLGCGTDAGLGAEPRQTDPLFSLTALVNRVTFTGMMADPTEAIDVDAALKLLTIESAKALGVEREVGSLEDGKAADLVVLSGDPRSRAIDSVKVSAVMIGGRWAVGEIGPVGS